MHEVIFPKPVEEVTATLVDIFRHQRQAEIVELLESSHAYFEDIEFDNWNGGTYTWALRLETPVRIFAVIEPRLERIEKEIRTKLSYLNRQHPNHPIGEVTIAPMAAGTMPLGQRVAPSDAEVRRLWQAGRFRLFLSHVSKHKVPVSQLKKALALRAVDTFVAHEDIEPSFEWQNEIELGLRSMHALAAIITPDFHGSLWTDQEVGWALGRGVLVVPVRLGIDPYGLFGRFQGVNGSLERTDALADALVKTLLANPQTHGEMRRALVDGFVTASSFDTAEAVGRFLADITDITDEERDTIWGACSDNMYVVGAGSVVDDMFAAIGEPPTVKSNEDADDIPF